MDNFKKTIVLLLLIVYIAACSALCYNTLFIVGSLLLLGGWAFWMKFKVDRIILIITGYFILIEIFACLYTNAPFRITRVFNYLYPIFISYFCLKICGREMLSRLEKIVYVLTVISLGIFAVQLAIPNVFDGLSPYFGDYLAKPYQENSPTSWYIFIYRYLPPDQYTNMARNSGFMWEPGAFAWICTIMLYYRWFTNGIKLLDKRVIVYILAIITTYSTAGYLALFFAFLLYLIQLKGSLRKYILLILLISIIPSIYRFDFMSDKIESYFVGSEEGAYGYHEETNTVEFNRYMFFIYVWGIIMSYPLGYGTHDIVTPWGENLISPNGLANILYHWGLIGFLFIFYGLNRFFNILGPTTRYTRLIATLSVSILLFSNPAHTNPLIFLLVLYPFIYNKQNSCESQSYAAIRSPMA